MKKLMYMSIVIIITIFMLAVNVYAYENDIFKIEVPSDYAEMSYSGLYTFVKSEERGIIIYAIESEGLKKDISTMSQSDVEEILNKFGGYGSTILEQKKEKLGKSKALKARVKDEENYMDAYIVVSDKHVLLVTFMADAESELDDLEYREIKKSFKMKERTTNTTLLKIGGIVIICVLGVLRYKRKNMQ